MHIWGTALLTSAGSDTAVISERIEQLENIDPSQAFTAVQRFFLRYGPSILWALGAWVVGYLLIAALKYFLKRLLKRTKVDKSQHKFILSALTILCQIVLLITCLGILGVPPTPLVTTLGAAGLAISLALQGTLGNIAGGISVLFSKPFSKENFVAIGSTTGTVKEIGLVYTLLHTSDNKHVYLPNGDVAKATIINYSRERLRRVELLFPVRADADFEEVKAILLSVIKAAPLAQPDPTPIVRASELSVAFVKFSCLVWTEPAHVLNLTAYLIETGRQALGKAGY